MIRFLTALGVVLVLGGLAHSAGVLRFYATSGVPDANRVLLDAWIAEAQLLSGGMYITAARNARRGLAWRALAVFGALTIAAFSVTMLPVLVTRAPIYFSVPPMLYTIAGAIVAAHAVRSAAA